MEETKKTQKGRVLQGKVVRVIGEDTVSVEVTKVFQNPLYRRLMNRKKKYLASLAGKEVTVGQKVSIQADKPSSKRKRWRIVK